MPSHRSIVIFSGGTAANHLVDIFESIRKSKDCPLSYIIPISDNGGSSSELIRVFGGPGIGDVRSRLVRLISRLPQGSPGFREREGIRVLINYRLSSTDARAAKMDWTDVVDGTSPLWRDISSAKREVIRSFLNLVNAEITKRSRPPNNTFDFTSASVGNLFLTGARLFSGSFESAIYLLGSVCGVDDESVKVIPSINSNFGHHIAAGLGDGTVVVGQNAISHPSPEAVAASADTIIAQSLNGNPESLGESLLRRSSGIEHYYGDEHDVRDEPDEEEEDAHLPGTLPTLRAKNITFNKDAHLNEELPARISRIWYINPYGQEILPPANPRAIQALNNAQAVIYSIGSLYTSLVPSLVLRGVGDALRRNTAATGAGIRTKILILNGCLDREVGPQSPHPGARGSTFSAADFIDAIVRAGEQSRGVVWDGEVSQVGASGINTPDQSKTGATSTPADHLDASSHATTRPGLPTWRSEGILRTSKFSASKAHSFLHTQQHLFPSPLPASTVNSAMPSREPSPSPIEAAPQITFRSSSAADGLSNLTVKNTTSSGTSKATTQLSRSTPDPIYKHYVTHLIHLPNSSSTPYVNKDLLASKYGIQCIRVYGRSAGEGEGMRYDHTALRNAIEAILGRRAEREPQRARRDDHVPQNVDGHDSTSAGRERSDAKGTSTAAEEEERSWRARGLARRNTLENNGRWVSSQ